VEIGWLQGGRLKLADYPSVEWKQVGGEGREVRVDWLSGLCMGP
jgi:hypothetical protein